VDRGCGVAEIASRLGVAKSTVSERLKLMRANAGDGVDPTKKESVATEEWAVVKPEVEAAVVADQADQAEEETAESVTPAGDGPEEPPEVPAEDGEELGPVAKAEAAIAEFERPFRERENAFRAKVQQLEARILELKKEFDSETYSGGTGEEALKRLQAAESELAAAKAALDTVKSWRTREQAHLDQLRDSLALAYQEELAVGQRVFIETKARMAGLRRAYMEAVAHHFRIEHRAANLAVAGFRACGGVFPIPGFKRLGPEELEITLADLHRAAGKPTSIPVFWPQVMNCLKRG